MCRTSAVVRWGLALVGSGLWLAAACSDSDPDSASAGTGAAGSGAQTAGSGSGAGGAQSSAAGQGAGAAGSGGHAASGGSSGVGGMQASTAGQSAGAAGSGAQTAAGAAAMNAGGSGAAGAGAAGSADAGAQGGSGGSTAGDGDAGMPLSDAVPSAGCGNSDAPASDRYSIDVGGTMREYILKLPDGYEPNTPYRLIFAWHGRMYSADWVANGDPPQTGPYFGIEAEADGQAIFVAPQALSSGWTNQGGRDMAFVDAMRDHLESELCVDQSRIFSVGFSMGAIMTLTIGCEEADVFRAIAPMSGSLPNDCTPAGPPIAYWGSHGNSDTTITPARGEAARDEFVMRNHCGGDPVATEPSGCVSYPDCDPGYPVTWCPFDGVHEPPQFAGPAIWGFLQAL